MKIVEHANLDIEGRKIPYRILFSKAARKLRVRIGPNGIDVIQPKERVNGEVQKFLRNNERWILNQVQRIEDLGKIRKKEKLNFGEILFRGEQVRVKCFASRNNSRENRVTWVDNEIIVFAGRDTKTPISRSLENWFRKQARIAIEHRLKILAPRLRGQLRRIYIMNQKTKWGNCSALQNLSFNWRLILAPDFVLKYIVTHEAVHLLVPDHSHRFWLTVQSFCPEMEKAKQWLSSQGRKLFEQIQFL